MSVSSAVADSIDALKRNPVLFVAGLAIALVNSAVLGVQTTASADSVGLLSMGGSFVAQLVSLFFLGGVYAMAQEGLRGQTTLRTLVAEGKANYLTLLGATLVMVVVTSVAFVAIAIVGVGGLLVAGPSLGGSGVRAAALLFAGLYLLGFLPLFFLQFYAVAVVVSDAGVVGSLKRSFALVRRNVLSTLGFDAVILTVSFVAAAPTVALYASQFDALTSTGGTVGLLDGFPPSLVAGYFVSSLALGTLTGAFLWTYQVSFYEQLDGHRSDPV